MTSPAPTDRSGMDEQPGNAPERHRVVLLMGPATYRSGAFLQAADRLGLAVVQGVDIPEPLSEQWQATLGLDFNDPDAAARKIADYVGQHPAEAIVSVDDGATLVAACAAQLAGLPHNDPDSALAARDKELMRERFRAAGVPVPWFRSWPIGSDPAAISREVPYPCVVKPTLLSGSRGVIRANDPEEFVAAWTRTATMLRSEGADPETTVMLVESFIPGVEVALEGLLTDGVLRVLALFDKPDPLDGPFFEETIYVTPSRLPAEVQAEISRMTERAAAAIGLRTGPVHAELRINDDGAWPIELAGRSIGGLCSTILEFGAGMSLEELILRHAVGMPLDATDRAGGAVGVMMIPIPRSGVLRCVEGVEAARQVPGVTGIEITARTNYPITPLPEGSAYLGFIFAQGTTPAAVEQTLRDAHAVLEIRIDRVIPLGRVP